MNAENKICAEARPIIQVNNLTKSFGKLEVLKGISETIYEGEVVSIIGPSGGGKSTFLRCLNLLETPDSGTILFRNSNITDRSVNVDQYRQHLGMVFQHFNIFPHLKVIDNVTLAPVLEKKIPKAQAKAAALRLLERVGLSDKKDEYPNRLSGGQKQRLAIVRALAMEPEIMLFDEPTSALDPEMVKEVLNVMFFPDTDCLKVHVQESFGAASGGYSLGGNAVSSVISLGIPFFSGRILYYFRISSLFFRITFFYFRRISEISKRQTTYNDRRSLKNAV